ncbi:putative alpha-1,3-mannosyltransferase MNN15 [Neolecta irregularis DAH-3]|uniref:Putative alpha-1,3-mannosyltransferase MNN15 n=1 Tax=Neolecta irregularis (strain DAH-3) TaxID=1198029 RepID=A0A1U7LIY7_NEOID|nr:putative alpha-1,3-mannosyltransferase MNN15 [Neolecta irregularis DAH-3]|eukprot:OLL22588.1 putative alpha-1,3-mannosyltransferase MNN15 [Neolecta irregularis DAH-3]
MFPPSFFLCRKITIACRLTFAVVISLCLLFYGKSIATFAELQLSPIPRAPIDLRAIEVLQNIEESSRRHYNPDILDYIEIKPYAQDFTALWNIHINNETRPPEVEDQLKETISNVAEILYPWTTAGQNRTFIQFIETIFIRDKGIVITPGRKQFRMCLHLVFSLRKIHQTSLPIEIVYAGDEDLTEQERNLLAGAGDNIHFIDIKQILTDPHNLIELPGMWAIKPFAILVSSFKEVVLIDADGIFLQNPEVVFQEQGYKETGTIFYHDRIIGGPSDNSFRLAETWLKNTKYLEDIKKDSHWLARRTGYEQESGVVVIDKMRTLSGLLMTCHMNLKRQREKISYVHFLGDKETFWLGYGISETPFRFTPGYVGIIGHYDGNTTTHACSLQMLHVDEGGHPLWMNNGLLSFKKGNGDLYATFEAWGYGESGRWSAAHDCLYYNEFKYGADTGSLSPIHPPLKELLNRMISLAKEMDKTAVKAGLITIVPGRNG